MTLLSACEAIGPQESEQPGYGISGGTAATQLFTATIGADTKTYLQYNDGVYKTVWSEGDYIYVINSETAEFEVCPIVEGVGTTTATFAGTMEADSYMAYFGSGWDIEEGQDKSEIYLRSYQNVFYRWDSNSGKYLNMFGPRDFPMIARSSTKSFEFQNICSVLKVSITGNGESVNDIYFTPNDESIGTHGSASVTYDGTEPVLTLENGGENRELWFDTQGDYLSSEPQDYYIVLPAQTYYGGFTLEIETYEGSKTVTVTEDIQMRRSRIRTLRVDYSEGIQEEEANWGVCGYFTDWAEGADIPMENIGDGWYVAREVEIGGNQDFKLRKNGLWDGSEVGVFADEVYADWGYVQTNARIPVYSRDYGATSNLYLYCYGIYDIWYNPTENCVYMMTSGMSPFDLPTMDNVSAETYGDVYNRDNNAYVKVNGMVMAKNSEGFFMQLCHTSAYGRHIFVDMSDSSFDLADLEVGHYIDLYALKTTITDDRYFDIAVLHDLQWLSILFDGSEYYWPESFLNLTDPAHFNGFAPDYPMPYTISGTLVYEYPYYYVMVEGVDNELRINNPQQLEEEADIKLDDMLMQYVRVDGYHYAMYNNGVGYCHDTVVSALASISGGGSTENIVPGDDIILTGVRK